MCLLHFLTCSVAERGFAVHEKPSRARARGEAVHGGKMALALFFNKLKE